MEGDPGLGSQMGEGSLGRGEWHWFSPIWASVAVKKCRQASIDRFPGGAYRTAGLDCDFRREDLPRRSTYYIAWPRVSLRT